VVVLTGRFGSFSRPCSEAVYRLRALVAAAYLRKRRLLRRGYIPSSWPIQYAFSQAGRPLGAALVFPLCVLAQWRLRSTRHRVRPVRDTWPSGSASYP